MSARLISGLEVEAAKLERLAVGYAMAGERGLAGSARAAALACSAAADALNDCDAAVAEARERARNA